MIVLHMRGANGRRVRDVDRVVTFLDAHVYGVVTDNRLGAEGIAALAPALGNLVSLTSLDLESTWAAICCDRATRGRRVCVWRRCAVEGCWRGDVVRVVTLCVWCGGRQQARCRGHGGTGAGVGQPGVANIAGPAGYVACHLLSYSI